MTALTIDFHNTLVESDAWFDLEVRTLVSSVLAWSDSHYGLPHRTVEAATDDAEYRRLRQAIRHHGHELEAVRSTSTILDRLGIDLPDEIISEAVHDLMYSLLDTATPVDGARELLQSTHQQGIPLAVVSIAIHHEFVESALERFGMRDYLGAVVTSASAGFYKSRPEIYWQALREIDRPARTATHLGDSLRFDVGGARLAGMGAIWFDRKGLGMNGETEFQPDLIVSNLQTSHNDVLHLLESGRSKA